MAKENEAKMSGGEVFDILIDAEKNGKEVAVEVYVGLDGKENKIYCIEKLLVVSIDHFVGLTEKGVTIQLSIDNTKEARINSI